MKRKNEVENNNNNNLNEEMNMSDLKTKTNSHNQTKKESKMITKIKIVRFVHCKNCMDNLPVGVSPLEYQWVSVGWTPKGFQIWCNRCDMNVGSYDFKGNKIGYDKDVEVE